MVESRVIVTGLRDLGKALKAADEQAPAALREAMKAVAEDVVGDVRPRVPHRSGRAASSYRARGGARGASIAFGGPKTAYVPWLDFGGRVGRAKSVRRPVIKGGRYLYPAIADNMEDIQEKVAKAISDITARYGLRVEGND